MPSIIQKTPHIVRILLGLMFFVFGLNGFLGFMPMPPHEGAAAAFLTGLGSAGYFFPVLKATEVLVGILLLSNRFVPLALAVLAPISINIFLFHTFLEPGAMALVIIGLHAYLAWSHRDAYRPMLAARHTLGVAPARARAPAPSTLNPASS